MARRKPCTLLCETTYGVSGVAVAGAADVKARAAEGGAVRVEIIKDSTRPIPADHRLIAERATADAASAHKEQRIRPDFVKAT